MVVVAVAQETQERSPPDLEAHAHQLNPVFSALTKWTEYFDHVVAFYAGTSKLEEHSSTREVGRVNQA